VADHGGAGQRRSRLFTVRIWSELAADRMEQRGSVRDVESGAFRSFRDWSDLTAFLAQQLDEERSVKGRT
jgi:hypothetical protein